MKKAGRLLNYTYLEAKDKNPLSKGPKIGQKIGKFNKWKSDLIKLAYHEGYIRHVSSYHMIAIKIEGKKLVFV